VVQDFLSQLLVFLAAAVIVVPVVKRLGLGSVLGFLVAGLFIGPWGFRLISDVDTILQFAEIGVALLLFLVGLELEPRRLWSMRRTVFGLGGAQIAVTVAVVAAIAYAAGQPWTVGLVAGMGFAMSSTAIVLATLAEKNLLPTPAGQASFAVLLAQDLAVIPLLLVLGLLAPGEKGAQIDSLVIVKAIGMVVAVIFVGRHLLRPVLRYIANTHLREIFVAFSLLLVLGTAALVHWVGLSLALGTFLAGVLLADSEYRHELEVDIDPFKGLLMGLFFIAVGMSVDVGLFTRATHIVLGLAFGLVALKIALLFPLVRLFGTCGRDAVIFALMLSQAGEFAFVLFGAAGAQGVLPRTTVDLLNAVVTASMLTTPFVLFAYERFVAPRLARGPERAADVIEEHNPVIVAGFGRFGQIVTRLLQGRGIGATIIDHDPNQIDLVRRFGWKAYYGDVTRLDLLERAGAADAKLLIVAVDNPGTARAAVELARSHFPNLKVIVRAHDRTDAFEYVDLGVPAVRETFGSAVEAGERALRLLGVGAHAARRFAQWFRRHDEEELVNLAAHRHDQKQLIERTQKARSDLEQLLRDEEGRLRHGSDGGGWN
jgi:glutathione-regulated potassium-efflux system ancillary protein KefC